MTVGGDTLYFANGTVTYNGVVYYYVTNLQGDVVAILNADGTAVVTYTYDAWGRILATDGTMAETLGEVNPLRYRGYVYDQETELYYLQSRYYDPEIGRFINADALVSTGQGILGNNMFVYCGNNPVNYIDPTGMRADSLGDIIAYIMYQSCGGGFAGSGGGGGAGTGLENIFGASASITTDLDEYEYEILPDYFPITLKVGGKSTASVVYGDSSKPISVYADGNLNHPFKSSRAGIKLNIYDFSLDVHLGLGDTGITGSITNGNDVYSLGLKLNLIELRLGVEGTHSVRNFNLTDTKYFDLSINGWYIIAAYVYAYSGQWIPSPCGAPCPRVA